ncbi:MAG: hypothetical protein R3F37_11025 [Candidatus Competibacteraceae bacterium]
MSINKPLPSTFSGRIKLGFFTLCIAATPMATCLADSFHSSAAKWPFELAAAQDARTQQAKQRNLSRYIQKTYRVHARKADTIVNTAFSSGARYNVSPELILAIIAVESTFGSGPLVPGARAV